MANTAFQTQYRQEFIAGFEQGESLLRQTVTTEAVIKGNQATFLVADSGGAEAVTRGVNGLIPATTDNLNQYTATLVEYHDLRRRTSFNIFASQGDGKRIMQMNSMKVMNRRVDKDILTELANATQTTGAATTASLALVTKVLAILGNNNVELDGDVYGAITPAFYSYLLQQKEFTSSDWVDRKPLPGSSRLKTFEWAGVKWIVHPNLPGKGTNAEVCYVWHKSAIGHAIDKETLTTVPGYVDEQDYSWARTTGYMGSKLLQNSGVVKINHDGSALVAS